MKQTTINKLKNTFVFILAIISLIILLLLSLLTVSHYPPMPTTSVFITIFLAVGIAFVVNWKED